MQRYVNVDLFIKDLMSSGKFSIDTILLINEIANKQDIIELPDNKDEK